MTTTMTQEWRSVQDDDVYSGFQLFTVYMGVLYLQLVLYFLGGKTGPTLWLCNSSRQGYGLVGGFQGVVYWKE